MTLTQWWPGTIAGLALHGLFRPYLPRGWRGVSRFFAVAVTDVLGGKRRFAS